MSGQWPQPYLQRCHTQGALSRVRRAQGSTLGALRVYVLELPRIKLNLSSLVLAQKQLPGKLCH